MEKASVLNRQMKVVMTQFLTRFLFFSMLIVFRCCSSNHGSVEKERTLGIIKPDGLSGNYTDRIKQLILESGFKISKEMVIQLDEENAANFYVEHSSKSFFTSLIKYMTSGPVLVMILEKEDIVAHWRDLIGPTDAGKAKITHPQRYKGDFPDVIKVNGMLADMSTFETDLKVQNAKDVPLDRILTRRQIDILTCHAWLLESKELEEKVAKISLQTSFPSEYTRLILLQSDSGKKVPESILVREIFNKINLRTKGDLNSQKIVFLGCLGVGFGNLTATAKNIPPGTEEPKSPEGAEILVKAASNCCSMLLDRCCCMCFIQACSSMNNQCAIVLSQLCTALACFECVNCCYELCACF